MVHQTVDNVSLTISSARIMCYTAAFVAPFLSATKPPAPYMASEQSVSATMNRDKEST
jgi:hypothetical protein